MWWYYGFLALEKSCVLANLQKVLNQLNFSIWAELENSYVKKPYVKMTYKNNYDNLGYYLAETKRAKVVEYNKNSSEIKYRCQLVVKLKAIKF